MSLPYEATEQMSFTYYLLLYYLLLMNTPIYDFATRYRDLRPARFHMPGHKGRGPLGCEELDLTEIPGADSLYEAGGIIAESEANASALFGCPTFYSTEGSSHCIRAMLLLACEARQRSRAQSAGRRNSSRFRILAARNVHSAFLSAAALLDPELVWLPAADGSYLSAELTPEALDAALTASEADAVYLSCPDYLGCLPDLRPLAELCHAHGALLLVDNAHGAYLRFLSPSRHPMDLGADLCCDSAHKTLPVLTGGAYLHVSQALLEQLDSCHGGTDGRKEGQRTAESRPYKAVREALALFGSTSPSYLVLQSLDLANPYLEVLPEQLAGFLPKLEALKARLRAAGRTLMGDEPLKLTLLPGAAVRDGENGSFDSASLRAGRQDRDENAAATSIACPPSGHELAAALEQRGVYCEFADPEHVVFMLSPSNDDEELERLEAALSEAAAASGSGCRQPDRMPLRGRPETVCTVREAMLSPAERIPAAQSLGQVLARPGVSCPPAVPILMPGERIDEAAVAAFAKYGIGEVSVLP